VRRRSFNALLTGTLGSVALSRHGRLLAQADSALRADIYTNVGARLLRHRIADDRASLTQIGEPIDLPEEVQEACQSGRFFYVASSDEHTSANPRNHYLNAFEVSTTGGLDAIGAPVRLPHRPIHISVDRTGHHLLAAFNDPSSVAVHPLRADGSIADALVQQEVLDAGIYAHQIRALPSGRAVIVPARGNEPVPGRRDEDPGALKLFSYRDGQLANVQTVAPNGGHGFRPRHIEFHRSGRWAYVVIESQNELHTFGIENDRLSPEPLFVTNLLAPGSQSRPGQAASAILMHPRDGNTLYVANRGRGTEMFRGEAVIAADAENSIAVLAIDAATGEPQLIQSADPQCVDIRMFALHPDGRSMVATSHEMDIPMYRRVGDGIEHVPPRIVLMSIAADGTLQVRYRKDVDANGMYQLWCGAVRY